MTTAGCWANLVEPKVHDAMLDVARLDILAPDEVAALLRRRIDVAVLDMPAGNHRAGDATLRRQSCVRFGVTLDVRPEGEHHPRLAAAELADVLHPARDLAAAAVAVRVHPKVPIRVLVPARTLLLESLG